MSATDPTETEPFKKTDYGDAARKMDAMYRYQRHIYDLTRKFYLLGRDRLIDTLPVVDGSQVLEIGCGTGRNLIKLARRSAKTASFFGIDISAEMLASAAVEINRRSRAPSIKLAQASSQNFDPKTKFGVAQFDIVYFSYVLSMIPDWRPAIEHALTLLKPNGVLAIVDFGDQSHGTLLRRRLLLAWLELFDVRPRAEIEAGLVELGRRSATIDCWEQLWNGYAYMIMMRRPPAF